jgi:ABC-type glycerol-3-phosphate transport system substrate-binding protein
LVGRAAQAQDQPRSDDHLWPQRGERDLRGGRRRVHGCRLDVLGEFNDKSKSLVAGKVGMARFPIGPRRKQPISWIDIWGWAIPKAVVPERQKLAKRLLGEFLTDIDGQIAMWNETGGPPPNVKAQDVLVKDDKVYQKLKDVVFDVDHVHSALYFANWPQVHKAYSDVAIKALTGPRDAIPQVLGAGVKTVHDAAVAQ